MSTREWIDHVKRVKDAYEQAGIRLSYNQALILAKESYKQVKAGNYDPEIIIDESQIPQHQAGRIKEADRKPKEVKYVEPKKVSVKLPPKRIQDDYEEEAPRRRPPPRVYEEEYEGEYEEDYHPAPRRRPPPRYEEKYYDYEDEPRYKAPPRGASSRGRARGY